MNGKTNFEFLILNFELGGEAWWASPLFVFMTEITEEAEIREVFMG
jgi:hypothetical protein